MLKNQNLKFDPLMDFSFVICTKNSSRCISKVLNSIKYQFKDITNTYEILIVDYKSSDNTQTIVENFKSKNELIKISLFNFDKPGKSPALVFGLNKAIGDYIVVVDDDTILFDDYLQNLKKIIKKGNIGILGSKGNLCNQKNLPNWFDEFKGHFAIGIPFEANDWVWGACRVIKNSAWKRLSHINFYLFLNPERKSNFSPIDIGGEDTELSLAIKSMGYDVKFYSELNFYHCFDEKRITKKYLLFNTYGTSKSIPLTEIYRSVIYNRNNKFHFILWNLKLVKYLVSLSVKSFINLFLLNFIKSIYYLFIILGIVKGVFIFYKKYFEIRNFILKFSYEKK